MMMLLLFIIIIIIVKYIKNVNKSKKMAAKSKLKALLSNVGSKRVTPLTCRKKQVSDILGKQLQINLYRFYLDASLKHLQHIL